MAKLINKHSAYIFLLPWLIGLLTLTIGALLYSFYLAFTNYDLIGSPEFIGAENFKQILNDSKFYKSISVTFLFVVISVPLRLIASLLIAILLNQNIKGIGVYRTVFYIPSIIGTSVGVAIMWQSIFSNDGLVNQVLELFGITSSVGWVSNPNTALYVIVLLMIWQFGSEMIIFLAGLKQIPGSLYEAAAIDGATAKSKFFSITLPMLTPMIFFNLVIGTINAFMIFTQGYIITGGGPMNSTLFYIIYLYKQAFEYFNMGYASALTIIILFIMGIVTLFLFLTSKFWVFYESEEG